MVSRGLFAGYYRSKIQPDLIFSACFWPIAAFPATATQSLSERSGHSASRAESTGFVSTHPSLPVNVKCQLRSESGRKCCGIENGAIDPIVDTATCHHLKPHLGIGTYRTLHFRECLFAGGFVTSAVGGVGQHGFSDSRNHFSRHLAKFFLGRSD